MEEREGVNLDERYIVLAIPKDTVEVEIKAKVWHGGEVLSVGKTMDFDEVRAMFEEAENGYIPEDAVFSLTDKGRDYLARLMAEQRSRMGYDE